MSDYDNTYKELLLRTLNGEAIEGRNGLVRSFPGTTFLSTLIKDIPILTLRRMYPQSVVGELKAFLTGSDHVSTFIGYGCNYWNDFVDDDGYLRGIYGYQWRNGLGIDQIANLISGLITEPYSRRHILQSYNPSSPLPACHCSAQFIVRRGRLNCTVYMRSCDIILGLPSDVILYALLTQLLARSTGYKTGTLTMIFADLHVYDQHVIQARELLLRDGYDAPSTKLYGSIDDDSWSLEVIDYEYHDAIKFELIK